MTSFTVQHSADGSTWIDVDGGATFTGASGNFDARFASPVMAQYIRITVVTWEGHISMRAGLLSGEPPPIPMAPVACGTQRGWPRSGRCTETAGLKALNELHEVRVQRIHPIVMSL